MTISVADQAFTPSEMAASREHRSEAFVFIVVDVLDLFRAVVDLGENDLGATAHRRLRFEANPSFRTVSQAENP